MKIFIATTILLLSTTSANGASEKLCGDSPEFSQFIANSLAPGTEIIFVGDVEFDGHLDGVITANVHAGAFWQGPKFQVKIEKEHVLKIPQGTRLTVVNNQTTLLNGFPQFYTALESAEGATYIMQCLHETAKYNWNETIQWEPGQSKPCSIGNFLGRDFENFDLDWSQIEIPERRKCVTPKEQKIKWNRKFDDANNGINL